MMPRLGWVWVSSDTCGTICACVLLGRLPRVVLSPVPAAGGRKAQYDMLSRSMVKNKDDTRKTKEENKAMQKKLKSLKMVSLPSTRI